MLATGILLAFSSSRTTTAPSKQLNSSNNASYLNNQSDSSEMPVVNNDSPTANVDTAYATTTPKGSVLNKHSVSLSATNPESNGDMISTCATEANVSCSLIAKDTSGSTITISDQKADGNGNVIFEWNASKLGLGNWEIHLEVKNQEGQILSSAIDHLDITQ